ncbi:hypothetical protein OIU93_04435 [Paeniglutamicibacter sp. ZC-3]|uniref:hypothetical protein n=1 Tax=Paeniglutamicibacter TaxID=1742990 RepID=UPI0021F7FE19|nr:MULTISPECIES: hypothetical protein [Paeniglutamicibacter]MCV9993544.1 hypothetical protein [Paeniglutamicibacter sp. ZC-3]MDO2934748.1 hypothetical protein [Paeniglutamicibacter sulfureus]
MKSSDSAKNESQGVEPSVFKLNETPEEQLEYFTVERRRTAVPREIELPDPDNLNDED